MAEVFGTIGNEHVELNNAATEATLRQLLQATVAVAKGNKTEIEKIAKKSGLDPDTIAVANREVNALGRVAATAGATWAGLNIASQQLSKGFTEVSVITAKLTEGNAQASDIIGRFAQLRGPVGALASGLQRLAEFQENQLASYQSLTKAGVNFGGSLTDLRLAASNAYMTMGEFTQLLSENGNALAKMGGSTDSGARAFSKLSNSLNSSELGKDLKSLGFTSKELNQGLIDYISLTGGRTRKELQNTSALTQGASQYLEQLDGLAKLTGESREALAAKMKEESANQAWEGYLLTLDEEGRKKANAARLEAEARGGKGAAQALQASLMGLPPMTVEAQKFVATMQNGSSGLNQLASNVTDSTKSIDDVKKSGAVFSAGLAEDGRRLQQVANAQIMAGKDVELFGKALKATNDATRNNVKTAEEQIAFEKKIAEEASRQKNSEATAAAQTQQRLQELGQAIMGQLMPAVAGLLSVFNPMIQAVTEFAILIAKTPIALGSLLGVVGLLTLAFIKHRVYMAQEAAKSVMRGTITNPMIVKDISGVSGPVSDLDTQKKGKPKAGKFGKISGGVGGLIGGIALDAASDFATESGYNKTGATLDIGSSALTGAGMGAMLGPIGAAVGGALGGAYGLYQNWGTLFGGSGKTVPSPTITTDETARNTDEAVSNALLSESMPNEMILATNKVENLTKNLEKLQANTSEMIRHLKEIAEQTRRNVDATRSLNGNLFSTV